MQVETTFPYTHARTREYVRGCVNRDIALLSFPPLVLFYSSIHNIIFINSSSLFIYAITFIDFRFQTSKGKRETDKMSGEG